MKIALSRSQKNHIYVLFFLVPFLLGTCIDLYVPSLPAITVYFHTSQHMAQLSIALYMLGYAIGQIFLGVLSDRWGRRKILIIGGFLYTLVSFIAAFASNIDLLILCRLLQGLTIAGPGVVFRALATDCFEGIELTKAVVCISISWSLGPILGPWIGGYLQHYFNWQADFYFFGIFGLITFIYASLVLAETHRHPISLHPKAVFKTLSEIITHPIFIIYATINSLLYAMLVVFNTIAPFLIQIDLHYSAIDYGRVALILGIGGLTGNLTNRFLINYLSANKIVFLALLLDVLVSLFMIIFGLGFKPYLSIIVITTFFLFCAGGLGAPNTAAMCLNLFPKAAGTASALFGSLLALEVFIMSSLATLLPTHSQTPMAFLFFAMSGVSLGLAILGKKIKNRVQN